MNHNLWFNRIFDLLNISLPCIDSGHNFNLWATEFDLRRIEPDLALISPTVGRIISVCWPRKLSHLKKWKVFFIKISNDQFFKISCNCSLISSEIGTNFSFAIRTWNVSRIVSFLVSHVSGSVLISIFWQGQKVEDLKFYLCVKMKSPM